MAFANRLNYIAENKDWNTFTTQVSQNTGKHYGEVWRENAKANKARIKECGWAAEELQDAHEGKTAVLLGASPAILKQMDKLKSLQWDADFTTIGVASGIKTFFEHGLIPRYCMIADADPAIVRFWKDVDMRKTKDITLIANICVHPSLLDKWQGDIKFLSIHVGVENLIRKFKKWFKDMNGCGEYFPALSSQYNEGVAFAALVFCCKVLIFVGNELSFPTQKAEDTYYPGRKDIKDTVQRKPHIDIYGNTVYTSYMLLSLKFGLEDFLGKIADIGWYLNATEAGIFGVSARYGNLPWIQQLNLDNAIMQARYIMEKGEPLTFAKPTLTETVQYS